VDGSNVALAGSSDTDRVTVLAGLELVPVTVKLIHVPDVTVLFPGSASVSGLGACTLTVVVAKPFAWGEAESVTVSVTR
jgi:hypothetical protein